MTEVKFTKTATFLFPLLGISKSLFKCHIVDTWGRLKFNDRFVNAYWKNNCIEKYKDKDYVFLVLRNYQDLEFTKFSTALQSFPNYVDEYDINDCFVAIFSVPEENQQDFDLIKQGAYSKVSPKGRELILMNNYFSGKAYTLPLIFNKAKILKDLWEERLSVPHSVVNIHEQEVWSIINEEKETLTKNIVSLLTKKKALTNS